MNENSNFKKIPEQRLMIQLSCYYLGKFDSDSIWFLGLKCQSNVRQYSTFQQMWKFHINSDLKFFAALTVFSEVFQW